MNPYMQFMNPFPHQGNQMQYQSYPHPNYEAIPPQFRGYPEGHHSFYHPPWASSGMNGFVYPSQNYGCCNHNFFPPYYPPYSHHPIHCCGGYSVPPGVHPCNFPPLNPATGPTQFEYRMDNPRHQHCFDCPNNTWKGGNNLKIEDQTEPKGDISVAPSDFKNSPYPIVLSPPNYIKDNRCRKANESTYNQQEVSPKGDEKLKPFEPHPLFLNGWLPVDIDKWRSSEQVDDSGKKIHKDNDKPYFLPPFFYVPYKADDMGMMEQKNVGQQCSEGVTSEQMADNPLSPIPTHLVSSENKSNDGVFICEGPKTMEKKNEDDFPPEKKGDENEAHVGNEARKASGDGKRKLSSPPKSSKLPPVCLRVDPLPKKKKGCSPSKPLSSGDEKGKEDTITKSKASPLPNRAELSQDDILARNNLKEQASTAKDRPKRKIKTIQVYDAESQPREDEDLGGQSNSPMPVTNNQDQKFAKETNLDIDACTDVPVLNVNGRSAHPFQVEDQPNHIHSEKNDLSKEVPLPGKSNESKRRVLSEDEAAKIIQSAYRGYKERKWEPLKNLKNIKEVQGKVTLLKKQIEDLVCTTDNTLLDKSRTVIGETIMNLLLKLDSIQGLPANVRQVRKSVASDLMRLQEQLDALEQRHAEKSFSSALLVKSEEEVDTMEDQEKDRLGLGSGNEIEEKKNHEEPPLIELSIGEENEVHKEDVPDLADPYTIQLNDLLLNGSESLKDESPHDVTSNTVNLKSESMISQSIHNDQGSGVHQPEDEDYESVKLIEEKRNCVPSMVPLESVENEYREPEQTSSSLKTANLIEMDVGNRPETGNEAPGHDTSDSNKVAANVEPVSEGVQEQNKSIELNETRSDRFEEPKPEPAIHLDEEYDAHADLTTLPQEQKQVDESLEMQTSKPVISSSQSSVADANMSLFEENERLREQLQKLIEGGKEQLYAISSLSRKVKDLERKLNGKKKVKVGRRCGGSRSSLFQNVCG